jgi:hypothetical protein
LCDALQDITTSTLTTLVGFSSTTIPSRTSLIQSCCLTVAVMGGRETTSLLTDSKPRKSRSSLDAAVLQPSPCPRERTLPTRAEVSRQIFLLHLRALRCRMICARLHRIVLFEGDYPSEVTWKWLLDDGDWAYEGGKVTVSLENSTRTPLLPYLTCPCLTFHRRGCAVR